MQISKPSRVNQVISKGARDTREIEAWVEENREIIATEIDQSRKSKGHQKVMTGKKIDECYRCHKRGHIAKFCWTKLREKQHNSAQYNRSSNNTNNANALTDSLDHMEIDDEHFIQQINEALDESINQWFPNGVPRVPRGTLGVPRDFELWH